MKYLDPDGMFTYDSHDQTIIHANLDDIDDLRAAGDAIAEADRGLKIHAYGEISGISKVFENYKQVSEYIGKSYTNYDLSYSNQVGGSKEEGARALYFDAFISNTNLNSAGINFGVAQATVPVLKIGENVKISLTLKAIDGMAQISSFPIPGFSLNGTICSATLDFSYKYNNITSTLSIGGMIGWGASFGLGPEGVYYNFSNGYGLIYSLNMEKDMNNEESN